jgi:hypothetical protein
MNLIPADTTIDAAVRQLEVLRKLSTAERAEMTFQLCDDLRRIAEAGVRYRHPDYDRQAVRRAVLFLTLGPTLFREAFGNIDIPV